MRFNKENIVLNKSFQFSLGIIKYAELLDAERKFVIANQLLKSGTSIGANIFEAQSAESNNDFIHKIKIADKEAIETEYWLLLCKESNHADCEYLLVQLDEIQKLLYKIIQTSKLKNK